MYTHTFFCKAVLFFLLYINFNYLYINDIMSLLILNCLKSNIRFHA